MSAAKLSCRVHVCTRPWPHAGGEAQSIDNPASEDPSHCACHPQLVLINVSDHHTRCRANGLNVAAGGRVQGCLLGQQDGRNVDISNSLEIVYSVAPDGALEIDEAFLLKKMDQCAMALMCRLTGQDSCADLDCDSDRAGVYAVKLHSNIIEWSACGGFRRAL